MGESNPLTAYKENVLPIHLLHLLTNDCVFFSNTILYYSINQCEEAEMVLVQSKKRKLSWDAQLELETISWEKNIWWKKPLTNQIQSSNFGDNFKSNQRHVSKLIAKIGKLTSLECRGKKLRNWPMIWSIFPIWAHD